MCDCNAQKLIMGQGRWGGGEREKFFFFTVTASMHEHWGSWEWGVGYNDNYQSINSPLQKCAQTIYCDNHRQKESGRVRLGLNLTY